MTRRLFPALASLLILTAAAPGADETPIPYGPVTVPPPIVTVVISPRQIALTEQALAHTDDSAVRVRLAGDLSQLGEGARSALARLLTDADPLVRAAAVAGLPGDASATALIGDASPVVRRAVVIANPTDAVLLKAYDDADPAVRVAAFARSSSASTDAALAARLPQQAAPSQAIICNTLATRKAASTATAIAPLLGSAALPARAAAIRALAALGSVTLEQLRPQLAYGHPAIRQVAATALAALPADQRLAPAMALLTDADLDVRTAAARVIEAVGDESAVAILLKQFPPEDPNLTAATTAALIAIAGRSPAARTAVDSAAGDLLDAPTPQLRIDGSTLLGALRSKTRLPRQVELLMDADWNVVRQVATSLAQIADPSTAPQLSEMAIRSAGIGDKDFAAWSASASSDLATARFAAGEQAVLACARMGYAPVIAGVRSVVLKKTAPLPIRIATIWAIGLLETPESAAPALGTLMGRSTDMEEMPEAISEAIKAAGNAKIVALESTLTSLRDDKSNPTLSIAAVMALDHIHGTHTPVTPETSTSTPQTTATDLTPAAK